MKTLSLPLAAIVLALALPAGLVACSRGSGTAFAGLDTAVSRSQAEARAAERRADQVAAHARDATTRLDLREDAPTTSAARDAAVAARVNARLNDEPELQGLPINVLIAQGAVWLRGRVPSPSAGARAEALSREIEGVRQVHNRLDVAGTDNRAASAVIRTPKNP